MEYIRSILYKIDFNEFENIILLLYFEKTQDLKEITNFLIDYYNLNANKLYFNFLSFKAVKNMIYDYVESFYVLNIRNQYVYSKTYFYSKITNKSNLIYDINWTKIKEAYNNKNYAIYDYFIELLDEASDEIGAGRNYEDVKDETGAREYRRKYGHLHKERNYMITAKQDSSDEVARFRRIYQSNIYIDKKVEVVGNYKFLNKIINFIKNSIEKYNYFRLNLIFILKFKFFEEDRNEYINKKIKGKIFGRKINYILTNIQNFLFSKAYCKFTTRIYYDEEDVGKENTDYKIRYDNFNFVIPLSYCFGCFNTHQYSFIQEQLINNSNIHFEDLEKDLMFIKNKAYFEEDNIKIGGGLIYD